MVKHIFDTKGLLPLLAFSKHKCQFADGSKECLAEGGRGSSGMAVGKGTHRKGHDRNESSSSERILH